MLQKPSRKRTLFLGIGAGIVGLCLCSCVGFFVLAKIVESDPSVWATRTAEAIAQATETARPTSTPTLTSTPVATETPVRTSTPTKVLTPTKTLSPTSTNAPVQTKLTVPAGTLSKYKDTYSNYREIFVYKKNGTLDARPNDLEELCLDWLFYRNKILEYTQAGNNEKAAQARTAFNEINAWLSEYNENDVQTMFSIIEKRGGR